MKYLGIGGFLAMATLCSLGWASTASASNPVITSPAGVEYTGSVDLSASSSFIVDLGFVQVTCTEWTKKGQIQTNTFGRATFAISAYTFTGCGTEAKIEVLATGSMEVLSGGEVIDSGDQFTVSKSGISCVYGGGTGTKFGTLKGGTPGSLVVSAELPKISGGFLCASKAKVSGTFALTTPSPVVVD